MRGVHGDLNVYICRECGHTTTSVLLLRGHKQSHNPLLRCSQCDYSTTDNFNLAHHVRVHTGEKPFKSLWTVQLQTYYQQQRALFFQGLRV